MEHPCVHYYLLFCQRVSEGCGVSGTPVTVECGVGGPRCIVTVGMLAGVSGGFLCLKPEVRISGIDTAHSADRLPPPPPWIAPG